MNIVDNKSLREQLSAAYVLGTLKGAARRRFETHLQHSALLHQEVQAWQQRLHPLAEFAGSQPPPAHVWQTIEARLGLRSSKRRADLQGWKNLFDNLRFWRGLALVSSTASALLLIVLLIHQPGAPIESTSYVAMLTDDHAQPNLMVVGDPVHHRLTAKILAGQSLTAEQSLQLWAIPKHGNPRSLGLLARDGSITLPMPTSAAPGDIVALAVSLEPLHGSPNPQGPTGPILFKGAWQQI